MLTVSHHDWNNCLRKTRNDWTHGDISCQTRVCPISRGLWKEGEVVLALMKHLCQGILSQLQLAGKGIAPACMCLVIICAYKAILYLLSDKMHWIASYGVLNLKFLQYAKKNNLGIPVFFLSEYIHWLCNMFPWEYFFSGNHITPVSGRCICKDTTSILLPQYVRSSIRPKEERYLFNHAQRLKWKEHLLNRTRRFIWVKIWWLLTWL